MKRPRQSSLNESINMFALILYHCYLNSPEHELVESKRSQDWSIFTDAEWDAMSPQDKQIFLDMF